MDSERLTLVLVGAAAVVLQALLAPAIAIGPAVPSFIVVAVLLVVVAAPEEPHHVFAFVMGLIADLMGSAPVGASAFALVACAFLLPRLVELVGNDNILMVLLIMLAGAFAAELLYSILLALSGALGFLDALGGIVFPCAPYDACLAFVLYLVLARLFAGRANHGGGATMTNVRFN